MYILSCICLSFVAFACAIGCYTRRYHDNLVQRFGMVVLGLGCVARVPAIWQAQAVNNDWFMIHGGMALIAAGTLWRHGSIDMPSLNLLIKLGIERAINFIKR